MRFWWLALPLWLGSVGWADTPAPTLRDPLPFDHGAHARPLEKAGLTCLSCHPVGLQRAGVDDKDLAVPLPPPPTSACHGCHGGEVRGAGKQAPPQCGLCHAVRAELRPEDHAFDWLSLHGDASRAPGQACSTCHTANTCLDCHDRRGAGATNPHGPGFQRFHGVEAQLDPRSCSACHTEASCVTCHTTGGTPW